MKTFNKFVLALAFAATVAACSATPTGIVDTNSSALTERTITLSDGRTITCITYASGSAGGVSCDW